MREKKFIGRGIYRGMNAVDAWEFRQRIFDEMIDYCEANNICSYADLVDYAAKNRYDDWFKVLVSNGGCKYMTKYFLRKNNFEHF